MASSYRTGPNALIRTFGPGNKITVGPGPGPVNQRWEWAGKSDYAGYANAQKSAAYTAANAQRNASFTPAAASPLTGALAGRVARNTGVALAPQGGAAAGGAKNPWLTDPGYLSALAAEQTGSMQADKALTAAQEQAITQFGDPAWAQAQGLNVSPLTAAAANANTLAGNSTIAGLQRTRDDNQQNILDTLSAHGVLDSGQTLYATGRNQQAYGTDLYNAEQTALGGLNTAQATDVSAKQGLHSDVTKALLQAYQTYTANPQYWGAANPGGTKAALNTAATTPATPAAAAPAAAAAPRAPAAPPPAPTPGWIRSGYGEVPSGLPVATALARTPTPTAQGARNVRAG